MARITGNNRDNTLNGTGRDDIISGRGGADNLFGRAGDDSLKGGAGDDFMVGGAGNDVFDGSPGRGDPEFDFDAVRYTDASESGGRGVYVNLKQGRARDTFGDRDRLIDIESVRGTAMDDTLIGGNKDNDSFEQFAGLQGRDRINGGSGFDEVRYDRDSSFGGSEGIVANLATGRITDAFGDVDQVRNVERVRASEFDDTFRGDDGDNQLRALAGRDTADGGAGWDTIG